MATTFRGNYLFPLDDTHNMSVLYFETDISSTETNYELAIREEVTDLIHQWRVIQGSVLTFRKDNEFFNCTETFHSTESGLYYAVDAGSRNYLFGRTASLPNMYQFQVCASFAVRAGGSWSGFIKTADGHYCYLMIYWVMRTEPENNAVGLSRPHDDHVGYAVYDILNNPLLIAVSRYNQTYAHGDLSAYLEGHPMKPAPIQSTDPYQQGGTSEPGGGEDATYTDESEEVDFPDVPALSAVDTGFVTIYIPTLDEITSLSRYLWNSDATTIDFWKKLVADPMDLILGLHIIPVSMQPDGSRSVVVGLIDTGVNMQYTVSQYIDVDCGTVHVNKFWDAYLDSDPYTKYELYLPYCGTHPIMADEVNGKDITVKYRIDLLSGACVAFVKCGDSVLYQFAGNCAAQIPITANQFSDMVRSAISVASAIGTMVATSGATAPMGITSIASTATNSSALKPAVEKSGAVSGMSGQLAIQTPYLMITRPRQCIPEDQNRFIGYPSYVTVNLNDLSGFNVVSAIHVENVPATSAELSELETILKEGAIY